MPTLYAAPISANARKPLALIDHLGLEVEIRTINVNRGEGQQPAFLANNPDGQIPVLVDGEFVLRESNTILCYLDIGAGATEPAGSDPKDRAELLQWLFWEASAWQPAIVEVLCAHVAHRLLPEVHPTPATPPHWTAPGLAGGLSRWATGLRAHRFWRRNGSPSPTLG